MKNRFMSREKERMDDKINVLNPSISREGIIKNKLISKVETTVSFLTLVFVGATALNSNSIDLTSCSSNESKSCSINYLDISNDREEVIMSNSVAVDLLQISNIDKINKMKMFQDDWNGTGGMKFTSGAIRTFLDVINNLNMQPWIAPTGRNSLLMQYELNDGSKLAFELAENKLDEVYVPNGDFSHAVTATYTQDFSRHVGESVKRFYGV